MSCIEIVFRTNADSQNWMQGDANKDQGWINLKGMKSVDWGSKKMRNCVRNARVGYMAGLTDRDESGCVGWQKTIT